ncbi:hypothetical protein ASPVEDRAFT_133353 [Aspergillus versicolor CBS 583.65]|uniref:Uncharacterized protein n=1 Tax=Aspergillus versicolor CBS 583.65 TaxID=1036611 RepID=A0A1L9PKX9_ASPVE|nr:uncharacterized protein ASPVEDRAFT_133353 [Aspergillus versicolor CBS 583.65]OJJ02161.1 hypothetical protein ASPVEDRAFT_133353 [Aspergillus versicolor CBS 583.65]
MSLRHRGLARAATIAEAPEPQRRNSTLSDSVSEARNTIRSSTDDLFFPRAARYHDDESPDEESHWQSAPLGLALLPAIAGIFFQNGSAVVTDVTLLILAAVFLNWSVRLPWEWYHSARTQVRQHESLYDLEPPSGLDATVPEPTQDTLEDGSDAGEGPRREQRTTSVSTTAIKELHIHELAALASCFIFPLIGTWVLHTIRAKLSRPSEGLVSNYNLTIFLLAAEIRPFKHLLRMVQTRTLHLQRVIASSEDDDRDRIDASEVHDLSKRLEELEAHVAETAASRLASNNNNHNNNNEYTLSLVSQATAEYRKGFQTDIDALNRAVRRHEKRTAVSAYQTESRLQLLEAKARDALSIAAAAQRSSAQQPKSIIAVILDWISTAVLFPVHIGISLASLPLLLAKRGALVCKDMVLGKTPTKKSPGNAGGGRGSGRTSKGKAPQSRKSVLSQQRRAKRESIIEE